MTDQKPLFESPHFTLHHLAEGVYAAIAIPGGAAYSNAGIIDLGNQVLIFDAFDNPLAAADLRTAAQEITGKPPAWLINSHFHGDHTSGNMVFEDCAILSTAYTRRKVAESAAEIEAMQRNPSEIEEMIRQEQQHIQEETDPERRKMMQNQISRWQYTLQTLPDLRLTLPNQTFDGKITFYGTSRQVELIAPGEAHTRGDCYLLLTEEKIIFTGDLCFFQIAPYMPGCNPAGWVQQLEQFEAMDFEIFIPGHGPIGNKTDLARQREYIQLVQHLAEQARQAGTPFESLLAEPLPAPYDTWARASKRHENNLRYLYENQK